MADILQVSADFLDGLKKDLTAHENKTTSTSPYPLGGYKNGKPIGFSRLGHELSLNRAGQALQFLAGYYEKAPNATVKSDIAETAGRIYKIFSGEPFITKYGADTFYTQAELNHQVYNLGKTPWEIGYLYSGPAAPLFLLGLMMCQKQGVMADPGWAKAKTHPEDYVIYPVMQRIHWRISQALLNSSSNKDSGLPSQLLQSRKYDVFYGQKVAPLAINATFIGASVVTLFRAMYGMAPRVPDTIVADAKKMFRLTRTDFGSTYDNNGNPVDAHSRDTTGHRLCVAVGHINAPRGAFPSIGYNSLVGMSMAVQSMSEAAHTGSTFRMLNSSPFLNNELRSDAMQIMNYYKFRLDEDGRLFELGAHNNMPGSAERAAEPRAKYLFEKAYSTNPNYGAWERATEAERQKFLDDHHFTYDASVAGNSTFYELSRQDSGTAFKGQAGYAYSFAWVLPKHSLLSTHLPNNYGPTSDKESWEIDYSKPHANRSLMQAFAGTGEAAHARVLSGLAANLLTHQTVVE